MRTRRKKSRNVLQPLEPRRLLVASIAGNVFYDDNLNGTQETGELNLSQWIIFQDSNNNGVVDGTSGTWNSTNSSFAINDKTTYTVPITVSGATGTIADVDVRINIAHAYLADLDLFLTSPNGIKIELCTDNGGAGHDFINTIFDDDAQQRINGISTSTNTARYRPEFSMGQWNGSSINGTWTLEVTDDSLGDTGTFFNWGMTIRNGEPDATTYADGAYLLETAASGALTVKPVIQSGYVAQRNSASVTVAAGGSVADVDFGVRLPPANIGGRVFNDLNANGSQDAGETGIAGRTVFLDLDDNGQLDKDEPGVVTNASGDYLFSGVKPQTYAVRTVLPFGWTQTLPVGAGAVASFATRIPGSASVRPTEYVQDQIIVSASSIKVIRARLSTRMTADLLKAINFASTRKLGADLSILTLRKGYDAAKVADRLLSVPDIRFASPNYIYHRAHATDPREYTPSDPQFSSQTFFTRIGAASAWDLSEGAGVKVAVIDDGVLLSHPDLAPNLWTNTAEIAGNGIDDDGNGYIDDRNGWDFTNSTGLGTGDNNPNPENGDSHGTHIAGVIAARTNNAINVAGVAGKATIVPIRFFGSGTWTSAVIYNAFKYAADIGAKVVNVSYNVDGFVDPLDPTYNAAVQYLDSRNVLHINSAGNENALDPARTKIESTIYVAAVDANDKKLSDSNYGSGVDICAPGEPILSTTNNAGNPSTGTMGGTSVAAAIVSGVAALIWAKNPSWTRDQVAAQLLSATDDVDALNPDFLGLLGSGRVDAYKALTQTLVPPKLGAIDGLPVDGGTVVIAPTTFVVQTSDVLDVGSANNASNWQLVSAGSDGVFATADDASVAMTKSSYKIASNGITFTIGPSLTPGVYRFIARSGASGLRDPFGRQLDGNGNGAGGDDRVVNFTMSTLAPARMVTPAPGTTSSGNNFGTRQSTSAAPSVTSAVLTLDVNQRLIVTFSQNIQTPPASAISLRNLSTGTSIATSAYFTSYNATAHTLTIQMNPGNYFAESSFRLTLSAAGVVNPQGVAMSADYNFDFGFNRADFDQSGVVDFNDLLILAQHYKQSGPYSQGDTNYDGVVNFDDLLALAQRYQGAAIVLPTRQRHESIALTLT